MGNASKTYLCLVFLV